MSNMAEQLVNTLLEKGMTICTAESCTGGLLASMIVDVPGASDVFGRGFITYANDAKHDLLGVSWEILDRYGAVSPEVAEQMAQGAANAAAAGEASSADRVPAGHDHAPESILPCVVGVGITGIAGPGGGTAEKPVGLVYIGCHVPRLTSGADASKQWDVAVASGRTAPGRMVENGASMPGSTFVEKCHFEGDRRTVRESAAAEAIRFVLKCLG